uniref:Proline dehydrogenase n=1 Tax=Eptatretus burgeri TaxID=7764 RepID=A0A8C4Q961_EPTBU
MPILSAPRVRLRHSTARALHSLFLVQNRSLTRSSVAFETYRATCRLLFPSMKQKLMTTSPYPSVATCTRIPISSSPRTAEVRQEHQLTHVARVEAPRQTSFVKPQTLSASVSSNLEDISMENAFTVLPLSRFAPSAEHLEFDAENTFRAKTLAEMARTLLVFRACSFQVLVDNSIELTTLSRRLLGPRLFKFIMKATFYGQFVAGPGVKEFSHTMYRLRSLGLQPLLAVPMEEDVQENRAGESWYDGNLEQMKVCVDLSRNDSFDSVSMHQTNSNHFGQSVLDSAIPRNEISARPMMQLKITALMSANLCKRISECLQEPSQARQLSAQAISHCLQHGDSCNFVCLNKSENEHLAASLTRLDIIAQYAKHHGVRVLVDAEYTYLNPALSLITLALMSKYNCPEPFVWNTYQCYLKSAEKSIMQDIQLSKEMGCGFGVKLVRGAYMDKERQLAQVGGYADPIQPSFEDTNKSYHSALDQLLELTSRHSDSYHMIIATHNEDSVRHAVQRMYDLSIPPASGCISFGQLFGMCDHVSLTLGSKGYLVYKSVPFGTIESVLPYLARRAQENRVVLAGIRREQELLRKAFWKRITLSA